jgi:hypothetical protein
MTPEEKVQELRNQYGDKALEVCETVYTALLYHEGKEGCPRQVDSEKIEFWWSVLLALGYEC